MRTTLPQWLKIDVLEKRGGSYTGTIESVAVRQMRNPFTTEAVDEPVVTFADGYKLVPNIGMRRDLMAKFGHETDDWCGRRNIQAHKRAKNPFFACLVVVETNHSEYFRNASIRTLRSTSG